MRKKRLFKIFAIVVAILTAILLILYLGRRWLFESTIVSEIQAAVRSSLGAEVNVEVKAIHGNWLTEVRVDGIDLKGGADSAYRQIEGLRIEAQYSAWDLLFGDLAGLTRVKVRCKKLRLDLRRSFATPASPQTLAEQTPGPVLADLLRILDAGASLTIDELQLEPAFLRPAKLSVEIPAREGKDARVLSRVLRIVAGDNKVDAMLSGDGNYQVAVSGKEAGRLLRAAGISTHAAIEETGDVALRITGNLDDSRLSARLDLATRSATGATLGAHADLQLTGGRLQIPKISVDLPGVQINGEDLDLPISGLSADDRDEVLAKKTLGELLIKVSDLTPYREQLPAALVDLLPIRGELALRVENGLVRVKPSTFHASGINVQLADGSFSLLDLPLRDFKTEHLLRAAAAGLKVNIDCNHELAVGLGESKLKFTGRIEGLVSGSVQQPRVTAKVKFQDVALDEHRIGSVEAALAFDGETASFESLAVAGARLDDESHVASIEGKASIRLPKGEDGSTKITFDLRADLAEDRLPPVDVAGALTIAADGGLRIDKAAITSPIADLEGAGRIDAAGLDLSLSGRVKQLRPITAALDLHALDGSLQLNSMKVRGSLTKPTISADIHLALSEIQETWFPVQARGDLPKTPLDLRLIVESNEHRVNFSKFDLAWGEKTGNHIAIDLSGPAPIQLGENFALTVVDNENPLHASVRVALDVAGASDHSVTIETDLRLKASHLDIPKLTLRTGEGSLTAKGLGLGLALADVLSGKPNWHLPLRGTIEASRYDFGDVVTRRLLASAESAASGLRELQGTMTGRLTLAGFLDQPDFGGAMQVDGGSFLVGEGPRISNLSFGIEFVKNRVDLSYRSEVAGNDPLSITAHIDTGTRSIQSSLAAKDKAAITGGLKVRGLDLTTLAKLTSIDQLRGLVEIDGKLGGTWSNLAPTLELRLNKAGWHMPDAPPLDDLAAVLRVARGEIDLTSLSAKVRGRTVTAKGHVTTNGKGPIWSALSEPIELTGRAEFSDLPLELLPTKGTALADIKGLIGGRAEFAGPWEKLDCKLVTDLESGSVKLAGLPRIDRVQLHLEADARASQLAGTTLTGSGTMGGEPLRITADYRTGGRDLAKGQLEASLQGERLLLVRKGGLKIRGDVDIKAVGPIDKVKVTGKVIVDDSKFIKRLSLVPDLKTQGGGGGASPFGPWSTGAKGLDFNIGIETRAPILVRTNVLDTDLNLSCRLVGTGDNLYLADACTSHSGTVRFPGMAMKISAMRLVFPDLNPTRPQVFVVAAGKRHGIRIQMRVEGPWDDPVVKLNSTPALQSKELWSLVTTGLRPASLAANDAQQNTAILATYVLQELVLGYFASESTEAQQSFVSRFTFEFGNEISRSGTETWAVKFDIGELGGIPTNFGLQLERDVYEDLNLGLVYRWRF